MKKPSRCSLQHLPRFSSQPQARCSRPRWRFHLPWRATALWPGSTCPSAGLIFTAPSSRGHQHTDSFTHFSSHTPSHMHSILWKCVGGCAAVHLLLSLWMSPLCGPLLASVSHSIRSLSPLFDQSQFCFLIQPDPPPAGPRGSCYVQTQKTQASQLNLAINQFLNSFIYECEINHTYLHVLLLHMVFYGDSWSGCRVIRVSERGLIRD